MMDALPDSAAGRTPVAWSDLSPFAQGYVEAMFAEWGPRLEAQTAGLAQPKSHRRLCFSDLSPEAIALVLRLCDETGDGPGTPEHGRILFRLHPLIPDLDGAGKVRLREP
jgi:hypothetical protein